MEETKLDDEKCDNFFVNQCAIMTCIIVFFSCQMHIKANLIICLNIANLTTNISVWWMRHLQLFLMLFSTQMIIKSTYSGTLDFGWIWPPPKPDVPQFWFQTPDFGKRCKYIVSWLIVDILGSSVIVGYSHDDHHRLWWPTAGTLEYASSLKAKSSPGT